MKPTARETENEWLVKAMQGDDDAFGNLVDAFQGPVYNLCYRMLGSREEAEDAAQETFIKAYRALKRYDRSRKFVNWILAIASNHCIDRIRKRKFQLLGLDDLIPVADKDIKMPEAAAVEGERVEAVHELLCSLDEKDRAVVVLRYWYDMSYDEIAILQDLSVSAVKSRLHRARKQLAVNWMDEQVPETIRQGRSHEASQI